MFKYLREVFAVSGDKTAVPVDTDPIGTVSYEEGYGPRYELDQADPDKLNIERRKLNQILYDATGNIQAWQQKCFPDFIDAVANGGTPFPYDLSAAVVGIGHAGYGVYFSTEAGNTAALSDATKWIAFSPSPPAIFSTGMVMDFELNSLPSGWVWCNGLTIGNAASGGTNRANADCYALFVGLWATRPNSVLPIQNSDGSAGTRGANADADWNANKRLPVSDDRGRTSVGHDTMNSGSPAGRMTGARPGGINAGQLGGFGGEQAHVQDISELVSHTHEFSARNDLAGVGGRPLSAASNLLGTPTWTFSTGGGLAMNITQPGIVRNRIVKL